MAVIYRLFGKARSETPIEVAEVVSAFLQDNDRFVFTAAILEGRDPRVELAIKERIEEIAEARRASLRIVQSAENPGLDGGRKK